MDVDGATNPVLVVTAMPLSRAARADLSELLGSDYVVVDIKTAPTSANILLTPVVSVQLLGTLRRMFPEARILFTELHDHAYGIELSGPLSRVAAKGPDGYFLANALDGVAPIVRAEARLQLAGSKQRTPPRIGPAHDEVEPLRPHLAGDDATGAVIWIREPFDGMSPPPGRWLDLDLVDDVVRGLLATPEPRESPLWAALVAESAEHLAREGGETTLVDVSGLTPIILAELQIRVASALVPSAHWPTPAVAAVSPPRRRPEDG